MLVSWVTLSGRRDVLCPQVNVLGFVTARRGEAGGWWGGWRGWRVGEAGWLVCRAGRGLGEEKRVLVAVLITSAAKYEAVEAFV